jgi:hypothetical protein
MKYYLTLLFLFLSSLQIAGAATSPNQTQNLPSPSRKYILNVPIETQLSKESYKGTAVWKVTITDATGKVLYKDNQSTMLGTLNVYWTWDSKDAVWLYNSDDGWIWRWKLTENGWLKEHLEDNIEAPIGLIPKYGSR